MIEALRKVERAAQLLRECGVGGVGTMAIDRLRRTIGRISPEQKAWDDRKIAADEAFDARTGFDTGGIQRLYDMDVAGPNARFGVNHIASDPDDFARAINALQINLQSFAFVDLGSGKGRAVLMAAGFPFREILGVEFAAEMDAVARRNVAKLSEGDQRRIKLVRDDAATCDLPEGPLVVYLYHPFGADLVKRVATRLFNNHCATKRAMRIVYVNPQHGDVWLSCGWGRTAVGQSYVILEPIGLA